MAFITQMLLDQGIRPPRQGRRDYRCRHCPGLFFRISHTGAMSWVLTLRVGGRQHHPTLGRLSDLPRLDQAVDLARKYQAEARAGRDPFADPDEPPADTIDRAVARYLAEYERRLRPSTHLAYTQIFRHDVLGRWAGRELGSITKADVMALLFEKSNARERPWRDEQAGAASQARHALSRLRAFFKWARANDFCCADPTAGVMPLAKPRSRDRVLSDDEIAAFWSCTEGWEGERTPWGALFRLLLLTGQRRGEVSGMRWSEVDIERRTWTIPAPRAKNAREHIVALSDLAMAELERLLPSGNSLPEGGDGLVFGRVPDASFTRAKATLDERMGVKGWTAHDLRRSAATGMARIGIALHVTELVLNHRSGSMGGIVGVYQKFQFLDERRAALEAWARFVAGLVGLGEANVVALRSA